MVEPPFIQGDENRDCSALQPCGFLHVRMCTETTLRGKPYFSSGQKEREHSVKTQNNTKRGCRRADLAGLRFGQGEQRTWGPFSL